MIQRKDEGETRKEAIMKKFKSTRLGRKWRDRDEVERRKKRRHKVLLFIPKKIVFHDYCLLCVFIKIGERTEG